ncbi:MAG: hypothetical protein NT161_02375 [Candidatus Nomurabacteria bacterium]|nr:hypothetical protein [Candidatus Nomurabacteria bacterium]
MKKYIIISFVFILSLFILNINNSADAQSYLRDCSLVSGYSLITGGSCTTVVNTMTVLNFKAMDPDGGNLSWTIDWGDNNSNSASSSRKICPSSFPNTTFSVGHAWTTPGTYNIKLGVSNCKAGGDASASFKVVVRSREDIQKLIPTNPVITPAPTATLTAVPEFLTYGSGGSSTIFVATTNATSCTIPWDKNIKRYYDPITSKFSSNANNNVAGGISSIIWTNKNPLTDEIKSAGQDAFLEVAPTSTTTYSISCTGLGGSVNNTTKINVIDPNKKPTATIFVNPTNIVVKGSVTITWSSTDATSCIAKLDKSGMNLGPLYNTWFGPRAILGEEIVKYNFSKQTLNFSAPGLYDFNITCTGPGGSASSTATITVDSSLNCTKKAWYQDKDGDGYGAGAPVMACDAPTNQYVADNTDCYDEPFRVNPTTGLLDLPTAARYAFPGSTSTTLSLLSATFYGDTPQRAYSSDRGDGSYDYNCDGVETKQSLIDTNHNGVTFYTVPSDKSTKIVSGYYVVTTLNTISDYLNYTGRWFDYSRDPVGYNSKWLEYQKTMGTCQPYSGEEAYVSTNVSPWVCSFATSQCRGVDATTPKYWIYGDSKCTSGVSTQSFYPAHICAATCN